MNHRQAIHRIPETIVSSLTQAEGLITGTMVKMFTIAGPVIVSGTVASALYGLVLVLLGYRG